MGVVPLLVATLLVSDLAARLHGLVVSPPPWTLREVFQVAGLPGQALFVTFNAWLALRLLRSRRAR
jgi:hypothetical protein